MSTLPVAHYLRELAPDAGRRRIGADLVSGKEEVERRVEEARMLGVLEGRAAVQAEFDARLKAQAASFEQKFAEARQAWVQAEGERLAGLLASAAEDLKHQIAEQVARVLRPFVADTARLRATDELKASLDRLLTNGEYGRVSISGPQDLIAAFKEHADGKGWNVVFQASQGVDLRVSLDETILETRIGEWTAAIKGEAK